MRYVNFSRSGENLLAAEVDHGYVDLTARWPWLRSVDDLLDQGIAAEHRELASALADIDSASAELLPPLIRPGKIFCIGLNYDEHRTEGEHPPVEFPTVFTRFADSHVAHRSPIIRPVETKAFDYEGELAVVIGRAGRRIPKEHAMDWVAGYSVYNDVTARDWQTHSSQWAPGKNFASSGAFGPSFVTADEIPDIRSSVLTTRVNGEVVQHAPIDELIFDIPTLISYLSTFTPLAAGDVIATGTPAGVGVSRSPQILLRAGDTIDVEVSSVGVLTNAVVDERVDALSRETEM